MHIIKHINNQIPEPLYLDLGNNKVNTNKWEI